jgi:hypothetical protein
MAQTEHSTVGGNPDGHTQWKNYTGCPFPPFSLEKKKKKGFEFSGYNKCNPFSPHPLLSLLLGLRSLVIPRNCKGPVIQEIVENLNPQSSTFPPYIFFFNFFNNNNFIMKNLSKTWPLCVFTYVR